MDTAQRGMGLDWAATRELIRRSVAEARRGRRRASPRAPAPTSSSPAAPTTLADVRAAYEEQCAFVEGAGAQVILMASRALAAAARGPDDYAERLRRACSGSSGRRRSCTGSARCSTRRSTDTGATADLDAASDTMLAIVAANRGRVDGVKVSLLDREREVALRRRLPGRRPALHRRRLPLPRADPRRRARPLRRAARDLRRDRARRGARRSPRSTPATRARYDEILAPTVPLSRHIFGAPTRHYKTGIVFLAYLNDHQRHFRMVGGQESARSVTHLAELFVLADRAGLIRDPDLAAARMRGVLELAGVPQP